MKVWRRVGLPVVGPAVLAVVGLPGGAVLGLVEVRTVSLVTVAGPVVVSPGRGAYRFVSFVLFALSLPSNPVILDQGLGLGGQ